MALISLAPDNDLGWIDGEDDSDYLGAFNLKSILQKAGKGISSVGKVFNKNVSVKTTVTPKAPATSLSVTPTTAAGVPTLQSKFDPIAYAKANPMIVGGAAVGLVVLFMVMKKKRGRL